jgi:predicted RNA methylase
MSEMIDRVARELCLALYDKDTTFPMVAAQKAARAAIAAMREPTEAMIEGTNYPNTTWDSGDADVWRAMIDAALKD